MNRGLSTLLQCWLLAACCLAVAEPVAAAGAVGDLAPPLALARVDIADAGAARLAELVADPGLAWWVEVDRVLVVAATVADLERLRGEWAVEVLDGSADPGRLTFVRGGHPGDLAALPGETLAVGGRWAVVRLPAGETAQAEGARAWPPHRDAGSTDGCGEPRQVYRFTPGVVLARAGANLSLPASAIEGAATDPSPLLALLDIDRWFAAASTLAAWNRYTHGGEILQARDWLVGQLAALPGITSVETPSFTVPGGPNGSTTAYNVVATMPGLADPGSLVLVGGHYDSRSQTSTTSLSAAPGAEDNASGCAGVLEIARVLSVKRPLKTVMFLCYAGEEQGLWGSDDHARDLVDAGLGPAVDLMLNLDMIGFSADDDLDVLVESDPGPGGFLFPYFSAAAAAHTDLRVVTDTSACCSDHVPYLDAFLPALLTIENDWNVYPGYHQTTDLPGLLTPVMAENILRMDLAVLALPEFAGQPLFYDGFETGDPSQWVEGSEP